MLREAAKALVKQASPTHPGDSQSLRTISMAVAEAVYHGTLADGVATETHDNVARAVADTMWTPKHD
jgi:malate dehydrogenase (oxaloacetate-decarboxylating)